MSPSDETLLRHLADRAEISDVQLQYATAVDTRDWELLRTCFTDDLEADFSSGFGFPVVRVKAEDWIEGIAPVMSALEATQHMITNHVITFDDDDHATCVAYVRAGHHDATSSGDSDLTVYGFYTNGFERTSTGWRIARCKLTVSWMTGNRGLLGGTSR